MNKIHRSKHKNEKDIKHQYKKIFDQFEKKLTSFIVINTPKKLGFRVAFYDISNNAKVSPEDVESTIQHMGLIVKNNTDSRKAVRLTNKIQQNRERQEGYAQPSSDTILEEKHSCYFETILDRMIDISAGLDEVKIVEHDDIDLMLSVKLQKEIEDLSDRYEDKIDELTKKFENNLSEMNTMRNNESLVIRNEFEMKITKLDSTIECYHDELEKSHCEHQHYKAIVDDMNNKPLIKMCNENKMKLAGSVFVLGVKKPDGTMIKSGMFNNILDISL